MHRLPGPAAALLVLVILPAGCRPGGRPAYGPRAVVATALLSDDERAGEAIFRRERCDRCHTLLDAPPEEGVARLPGGPPAGGWRSRVGPDLGLEGHRRSDDWHDAHLYAPGSVVRGTPMPPYRHLFDAREGVPRPTAEGRRLVAYLQALGRARRDVWAEWRSIEPAIPPPPAVDEDLMVRGEELYHRHCVACHGPAGDGRGEAASLLLFPPRDFTAALYRFRSTPTGTPPADADLYRAITLGGGLGAAMPHFDWLPPRDRWALVLRVKQFSPALRGGGLCASGGRVVVPPAPPGRAGGGARMVTRGRRMWDDLGCAACHGAAGEGMGAEESGASWTDAAGAPVPRATDLRDPCGYRGGASDAAIDRVLRWGTAGAMPAYEPPAGGGTWDPLIAFLRSLSPAAPPAAEAATSPGTPGRR
ncbi:MAG: c-type cytochrome [Candidatus Polarisedimenticolia bacterium]